MTEPQKTVWPAFRYDDAPGAIRFLADVLGFRETIVVPGENGEIAHAELRWPEGGGVMLGSTKFTEGTHGAMKSGVGFAYVVTDDVDAVYARCLDAKAELVEDLHDTDYGSHTFTVQDPEHNQWTFGTYRGAP